MENPKNSNILTSQVRTNLRNKEEYQSLNHKTFFNGRQTTKTVTRREEAASAKHLRFLFLCTTNLFSRNTNDECPLLERKNAGFLQKAKSYFKWNEKWKNRDWFHSFHHPLSIRFAENEEEESEKCERKKAKLDCCEVFEEIIIAFTLCCFREHLIEHTNISQSCITFAFIVNAKICTSSSAFNNAFFNCFEFHFHVVLFDFTFLVIN